MPTIKDIPIEVIEKILGFLNVREEMAAAESCPIFDNASKIQVETNSCFRIREGKRTLVLVLSETDCKSAMATALIYYDSVHIILGRSIAESNGCDQLYGLRKWCDEVTCDGVAPFSSIEVTGVIPSCGCGFAVFTRYAHESHAHFI